MPFPAALSHGTAALLEDQESLQACSHLIMSLLGLVPLCPWPVPWHAHSQRGCCGGMLLSHSFLCMLLIGVAVGALLAGHDWPSQWDDPAWKPWLGLSSCITVVEASPLKGCRCLSRRCLPGTSTPSASTLGSQSLIILP